MQGNVSRVVLFGTGLVALVTLGWILTGHAANPLSEGLPIDWTHQHVIFSQPQTFEEVGRLAGDPRYWQQWYRQHVARVISANGESSIESAYTQTGESVDNSASNDWVQTLGAGGSVGAGNFPAKYSFNINTANCVSNPTNAPPDFVVFSTGLASSTQASIVAYDNLYSGCTGTVPSVYWAYNTSAQILTSPVFSRDGSQIAFVQTTNPVGGVASLVLLKWAASTTETVGSPLTLTPVSSPSAYLSCTAPCMLTLPLKSGTGTATNNTTSSVYYDYVGDTAWVGDASSWLHRFNPVFSGTGTNPPGEVTTPPWPVQVNATAPTALTSPVHDTASGNVFVGDQGGFLYSVNVSTGSVSASARVDFGVGLVDGPILDRTAEKVYVFSSSDGTTNCPGAAPSPCSAVYQFPATFSGGATGTEIPVGTSSATPNPLYSGAFDNAFYSSSLRTGNLYVCGDTGVNPILYRVPITGGVLGAATQVVTITAAGNHRTCSPVTDIFNPNGSVGSQERTYFSVVSNGDPTGCAGGCAISFVSMPWTALTGFQVGQEILVYRPANGRHYINVAVQTGTSGTTAPAWPGPAGIVTPDGGVRWLNQGLVQLGAFGAWARLHTYALRSRILDSNGNIEVVTAVGTSGVGTSGGSAPTWNTTPGGTTLDGTGTTQITWTNAGALPSVALASAGGTSGIIIDNTVSQATQAGASQIYFSTLANQKCPTTSTGCAVQTSQ